MKKIQGVSLFLRVLFQVAIIFLPASLAWYWIAVSYHISAILPISFIPDGLRILHPLTSTDILLGFSIGLLPTICQMIILYYLIKLFLLYEQSKFFTLPNIRCLKKIGIFMLVTQLANIVYDGLISFALTIHNPHGLRVALFTFNSYQAYDVVVAIMVILIAWVMAEGQKLQEEQQHTV